jgi:hypothetical protein
LSRFTHNYYSVLFEIKSLDGNLSCRARKIP